MRKLSFVLIGLLCLMLTQFTSNSVSAASGKFFGLFDKSPTDAEVKQILAKWRDQIKPILDPQVVSEIENYVSNVPLELPAGSPPFELDLTENKQEKQTDAKPKANRRDWAYALCGAGSSMLGCSFEGYEDHMDIALWCFIEAALLHLEPDHLSNVAFYLLEKSALEDAQTLLAYAYFKDSMNYGVLANLAHLLALKGDFNNAVESQKLAMTGNPRSKVIKEKLKAYADKAGVKVFIPKSPDDSGDSSQSDTSQNSSQTFPPDYVPSQPFPELNKKVFMINMKNYNDNIFGKWTNYVWKPIHEQRDPSSAENQHFRRLDRNREAYDACQESCSNKFKALGPDLFECQCQCRMNQCQADYSSATQYFNEAANAYKRFRTEAHAENEKALEEMVKLVNAAASDIYPEELDFIGKFIQDSYLNNYDFIETEYERLEYIWGDVELYHDDLMAAMDACNKQRASMQPPIKPEDQFGKPPTTIELKRNPSPYFHAKCWFWFGSMAMAPDGTFSLSVSPTKYAVSLKGKYNAETNEWGTGVGLGISASKFGKAGKLVDAVSSAEYTFFYDSKKGLQSDFTAELRPKIGFFAGQNPTYTIKVYH